MRSALTGALALAFPIECAGCGDEDVGLCEDCRAELAPVVQIQRLDGGLVVYSGLGFDGVRARVLRAFKEDGRTSLARALAPAMSAATAHAAAGIDELVFVSLPTSRAAFRRRGYRVVDLVAHRAGLRIAPLLRVERATADQRGLGREERRDNVRGSLSARNARGRRVVLLDDVVTTGATLSEAHRALRHAGAEVIGAATIAATARRGIHEVNALGTYA